MVKGSVKQSKTSVVEYFLLIIEGVLPEEKDTVSSLGWKLLRMETSQGQTLRGEEVKGS